MQPLQGSVYKIGNYKISTKNCMALCMLIDGVSDAVALKFADCGHDVSDWQECFARKQ